MNSSQATCLLCLSMNKNTINLYSDEGKELNIISILLTHFWFSLDEINALSQNICYECLNKTESFHEFYQSIRIAHKKFETVFVKVEKDLDIADDGAIYQPVQVQHDNFITEFFKIENIQDADEDESSNTSVCEIAHTNSIDTESRAFDVLPKTTQATYLKSYKKFLAWKSDGNISDEECFSEAVILEYFYYLKTKNKPSSLWSHYSMLRTTVQRNHNVDISYPEVTSFLKKSAVGFRSQKYVFQPDELNRFFSEAKDFEFLSIKVIMIFLIYGVTRTDDLVKVGVNDVCEQGSVFVIRIPDPKTGFRSFTVENEYAACIRKYKELRPANVTYNRFFLKCHKGKCIAQPIGKNKFRSAPKVIANFLNLADAESYTCYSFCRASIGNKRKINSEQNTFEGPTEAIITSTITSSIDSSTNAIASTVLATAINTCENANHTNHTFDVLPEKSQSKYLRSYDRFMAWKADEQIDKECFSEEVMLEYFNYMKIKYKPTSLWAEYSMLKATIQKNDNVDISSYPEIKSFLKMSSFAYLPRKSAIFQPFEIQRFLCEADDYKFLAVKVVMIFAIYGVTKADELTKIDVNDVIEHGSVFVIKIPDAKLNGFRSFTVENEYATYVQKYKQLRPQNISHSHSRFFINYQKGKCTVQVIGKNKLLSTSKVIANFLNLKDAENYSLLSFRKTSLKRGMHSSSVLDSHTDECIPNKRKTGDLDLEEIKCEISTETITTSVDASSVPTTAKEDVEATALDSLPGKSRENYVRSYDNFMAWKADENIDKDCFSEAVMLQYFNYLKPMYKPTSLWAEYSKLKATIQKNYNVDISYPEVRSFLRSISSGYHPQKCNFFQPDEIQRFLSDSEDNEFLSVKVIMIFAIYGITKADELTKVDVNDVIEHGSVFVIKVPDTKTNGAFRSLTVENEYASYVQRYKELRPENISHSRFFINYQKGKCTAQAIGKNKLLSTPKVIAKFLNLEDPENYTLHSFRKKPLKRGMHFSTLFNYPNTSTTTV